MTERERLIELLDHYIEELKPETLADYLLANGVIVPPCKVGDTIYTIKGNSVKEYKVDYFDIFKNKVNYVFKIHLISDQWSDFIYSDDFDKIAFLSRKEAEKALKRRSKKHG